MKSKHTLGKPEPDTIKIELGSIISPQSSFYTGYELMRDGLPNNQNDLITPLTDGSGFFCEKNVKNLPIESNKNILAHFI